MPRLPQPGGDAGNWGEILNDFLSVEHEANGTLKPTGSLQSKANKTDLDTLSSRTTAIEQNGWVTVNRLAAGSVTNEKLSTDIQTSVAAASSLSGSVLSQSLVGIGDSNMESPSFDWLGLVAGYLGNIQYTNLGKSGWSSSDIAVRQGGIDPIVTVTGDMIPASGPVTITSFSPNTSYRSNGTGPFFWSVVLCGVAGQLIHYLDTNTWTFTRTTSGDPVPCPAGSILHCTTGDAYRDRIAIF